MMTLSEALVALTQLNAAGTPTAKQLMDLAAQVTLDVA